jgi:hypothetical protein
MDVRGAGKYEASVKSCPETGREKGGRPRQPFQGKA